jgi:hypothetical protein
VEFLSVLLLLLVIVAVALWLFVARQGDAEFEFLVDQRTDIKLEELTGDTVVFSCNIPFVNKGTQDGTIMDLYPRHLLPQEQFDAVEVSSRLELETRPRKDGYFEALIVPKTTGNAVILTLTFRTKGGDIRRAMTEMVDMRVDIVFQIVGRSKWYITKQPMMVPADEIARALAAGHAEA